jgi:hypothetical protein
MHAEAGPAPSQGQQAGNPTVWFALLGGPLAWFAHLLAVYGLAYVPCALWLPLHLLATLAAVAVAIAAGVVSFRLHQSNDHADQSTRSGRNWFVGYGGLLNSGLFLLIIVVTATPPLILGQCA